MRLPFGSQHSSLSPEKWSRFTLDEQILMIANEMNRASKLFGVEDIVRLGNCCERVMRLRDRTVAVNCKPTLRRELLRWRDLIAVLYVSTVPQRTYHERAFKSLLLCTSRCRAEGCSVLLRPQELGRRKYSFHSR